jgi:hypothetical protein
MIVFGDPRFETTLSELAGAIRRHAASVTPGDLDFVRALLIQTGQLEQAISDLAPEPSLLKAAAMRATDRAAELFITALAPQYELVPCARQDSSSIQSDHIAELAALAAEGGAIPLRVKVPEGFEFYTLYPEQYCVSALRWAEQINGSPGEPVLVVGIRSIGTTLSAVVAAVLRAAGLQARRLTVRPGGHPFHRECALQSEQISPAQHAIIVDEGPGISGSSFMSVSQALCRAGMRPERIRIFPGHPHGPGHGASNEAAEWWAQASRIVTSVDEIRWSGRTLREALVEASTDRPGTGPRPRIEDFSAGEWRKAAYSNEAEWPAVCAPFESTKYRCSGERQSVLWKFTGLGAFVDELKTAAQIIPRTGEGTPERAGWVRGFSGFRWIDGRRLTASDAARPEVLKGVGDFLCRKAGPPLAAAELERSVQRLREMLSFNGRQALGEEWQPQFPVPACGGLRDCPSSSGAGWSPSEWVLTERGQLINTDPAGHDLGHTMVGQQPVVWDIAAVLIEWELANELRRSFLRHLADSGLRIEGRDLFFFEAAYAAFRMGQTFLCASMLGENSGEHQRLMEAYGRYREALLRIRG